MQAAKQFACAALLCALASQPLSAATVADSGPNDSTTPVVIYRVRDTDTLISLTRRLVIAGHRWQELAAFNRLARPDRLKPGSDLRLPIDWLRWEPGNTTVVSSSGTVRSDQGTLQPGAIIAAGTHLSTGADGMLVLALPDGSQLVIPGNSTLLLQRARALPGSDAPDIGVELSSGQTDVKARKHRDTGRFEIKTPTAVTAVRGTEFRVHFTPQADTATAETLEGVVAVATPAAAVSVPQNYGTAAGRSGPPLPPVQLLAPPDLAGVAQRSTTATASISFAPVAGARTYRLQVSGSEDFVPLLQDLSLPDTRAQLDALPDGSYWIRVRALDANGIEGRDATRRIEIRALPAAPAVTSTTGTQSVAGTPGVLQWSGQGARFHVQLATDEAFTSPLLDRNDLDAHALQAGDLAPGRYFWRVAALSGSGESGPWSAVQTLVRRPAAAQILAIDAGRDHPPLLQLPEAATGYRCVVQVARDALFTRAVQQQSCDGPRLQWPKLRGGRYFARARWVDEAGYSGEPGAVREFRVPYPTWPAWLIAPLGAAMLLW